MTAGQFHVRAVASVDETLGLLSGVPAGIVVALDPARPTTRALEVALAISGDGGGLRGIFI